jgi:hypothetical protein
MSESTPTDTKGTTLDNLKLELAAARSERREFLNKAEEVMPKIKDIEWRIFQAKQRIRHDESWRKHQRISKVLRLSILHGAGKRKKEIVQIMSLTDGQYNDLMRSLRSYEDGIPERNGRITPDE